MLDWNPDYIPFKRIIANISMQQLILLQLLLQPLLAIEQTSQLPLTYQLCMIFDLKSAHGRVFNAFSKEKIKRKLFQ